MNKKIMVELAEPYLSECESTCKSDKTLVNYERTLRLFTESIPNSGMEITPRTICKYRDGLLKTVSGATARQYLLELSAFFGWAVRKGYERENPVILSDIPKAKAAKESVLLSPADISALLTPPNKNGEKAKRNYALICVLLQSGMRNSEIRSLRICDLDFANSTILVRHGKGDKSRAVPFPELSQKSVKAYLNGRKDGYLFPGDGGEQMNICSLNQLVKRIVKKITGKDIHTHTLRHAAASIWADMGVPIRDVQLALGHASITTTERVYVHILNRNGAANKINNAFKKALTESEN